MSIALPLRMPVLPASWRRAYDRLGWLQGTVLNLALAGAYLLVDPLTAEDHRPWAVVVGSYLAVFLLADGVTTNVLGADARRVTASLRRGARLGRVLLVRNLTVLLVLGLPILAVTAMITVSAESTAELMITLPGVTLVLLVWLGIGNLISVVHPVAAATVRQRWQRRGDRRATVRWVVAVALPWVLCLASDPICDALIHVLRVAGLVRFGSFATSGASILVLGLLLYAVGTLVALALDRRRPVITRW